MKILDVFTSKEPGSLDTVEWILRVTVVTLAMIMLAVIVAMLFGLFVKDIDNGEIFSIIGPAFNTIVGAFVGLLGGLSLNNVNGKEKPLELTEPAPEPDAPEPEPVAYHPVETTPVVSHETTSVIDNDDDDDDDDDMAPWEKYRNDLRYDANGDGVVDEDDFPDWRNPAA
jgi:hypothetical protein